jgi:hypothetical protein
VIVDAHMHMLPDRLAAAERAVHGGSAERLLAR